MFCLDTNTCLFFLHGTYESIKHKILSTPPNEIGIPSVVKAELLLGAYKSKNRHTTLDRVERFLKPFEILPFTDQATSFYARIRAETEKKGEIVGPNDLLIAAIVQSHASILVTHNTREFKRIKGLKIVDWVSATAA